jgi:thiol-disulfide isomerase/thioredoxin
VIFPYIAKQCNHCYNGTEMELLRPTVRAPEFPESSWVNSLRPITMASLRGSVVLIQIWDFTCIHCLRTLPYLRAWHQRYAIDGLTMIGVHTPEFSFARDGSQVKTAAGRLGISWPVVLDNDQAIWQSYSNRIWPTLYLIDTEGYLRYQRAGEGGYAQTERAIHALLETIHPQKSFPDPIAPLRHEDAPGAVCYPTTPELQLDAIGNPQKPVKTPSLLKIPKQRSEGHFYLKGWWQQSKDGLTLVSENGSILLNYHAASVHGVFAPSPDPVDQALDLVQPILVQIDQDGKPLPKEYYTEDLFNLESAACLRVDQARSYALAQNADVRTRELLVKIKGAGLTFYAFSFGTCIDPEASDHNQL